VENAVARIAWDVHRRWRTGVSVRRLPPHVSLKQPFECGESPHDLVRLEAYLAGLAADTPPLALEPAGFVAWGALFGLDICETPQLRALHRRLNRELPSIVGGEAAAPFDGPDYRFHMTVTAGGASPDTYREVVETYAGTPVPPAFFASEAALFVYDEPEPGRWEYLMYAALPLRGGA
jgi:2'-5' RNA ligase